MTTLPEGIQSQDWAKILNSLYENEIFVHYDHERISEEEYRTFDWIPDDSPVIEETDLTREEAITELKYLESAGLADFIHPDENHQFVSYRLTDEGFQVIHNLRGAQQQAEWRDKQREWEAQKQAWREEQQNLQASIASIDNTLTAATIILAGTAIVQSLHQFTSPQILTNILDITAVAVLLFSLLIAFVFWQRGR